MLFEMEKPPNKHTKSMGELIRKAREGTDLTQEQLAEKIYRADLLCLRSVGRQGNYQC